MKKRNPLLLKAKLKNFFSERSLTVFLILVCCCFAMMAQTDKGAGAVLSVATEIKKYLEPVRNLIYAIACVISLVGAFNIYFKMQNGDQDVKKTIMLTLGGAIALISLATALPSMFN